MKNTSDLLAMFRAPNETSGRREICWQQLLIPTILVLVSAGCVFTPGMGNPKLVGAPVKADRANDKMNEKGVSDADIKIRQVRDYQVHRSGKKIDSRASAGTVTSKGQYKIGPGDVLSIVVWNHPKLSRVERVAESDTLITPFEVQHDGRLFFPYAGIISAAGKTVEEIRQILTRKLSRFVKTPQVSVVVTKYNSQRVLMLGEVEKPGVIPLTGKPLTVLEAISLAGGIKSTASLGEISIFGKSGKRVVNLHDLLRRGKMDQNIVLRDGDILRVPDNRREKVFVLGEIKKPQSLQMIDGVMTLGEAIADSGGLDQNTANARNVFVIRDNFNNPEVYHLDLRQADSMLVADRFDLMPRDVVFVSTAGVTRWNRVLNQLIPSLQTLFYVDSLAK